MKTQNIKKIVKDSEKKSLKGTMKGEFVVGDEIAKPDMTEVSVVGKDETVEIKAGQTVVVFSSESKPAKLVGLPVRALRDCTLTGPALFVESDIDVPIISDAFIEKQKIDIWEGDAQFLAIFGGFGIAALAGLWVAGVEYFFTTGAESGGFFEIALGLIWMIGVPFGAGLFTVYAADEIHACGMTEASMRISTKKKFPLKGISLKDVQSDDGVNSVQKGE